MTDTRQKIDRLVRLIEQGRQVIETHEPPPPNVISSFTLDEGAFNRWRSQSLAFLEAELPPLHAYQRSFGSEVTANTKDDVRSGIGILEGLKEDLQEELEGAQYGQSPPANGESPLHPWPIISTALFDRTSDEVVLITSLAGLVVDWSLTARDNFSHTTRKRAYLPRVNAAYRQLPDEEKLAVAKSVAAELVERDPDLSDVLNGRLSRIRWALGPQGLVPTDREMVELFFPKGTEHDAYVRLREILAQVESSVEIIDPYVDGSVLKLLAGAVDHECAVNILTRHVPADFSREVERFMKQHSRFKVAVRQTGEFHDRFVILDRKICFHIGASIKDAGSKGFMISRLEDPKNAALLIESQLGSWETATPL